MNFKVRKIRKTKKENPFLSFLKKRKKFLIFCGIGILAIAGVSSALKGVFSEGDRRPIFSFSLLKTDQYNHTNILLLGVAGKSEEGGHLSDSIMIASIDPDRPSISLLSLPRDLYIPSKIGERKINEIYAAAQYKYGEKKGLDIIKSAVSDFTDTDIHHAAVIDFQIFSDVIDLLGGIDIFVPEDIVDPFYPDENYGYQTFTIRKGLQNLSGETALKYARSRKTSSDYNRARRQQEIFLAMRRKFESEGLASNSGKLSEIYDIFRRRVNTDIGLKQMFSLSKIGMGIDYGDIVSSVLNDDPNQKGGLLFTPAKEFYGGQFVLLPEDIEDTKHFMHLVLHEPDVLLENAQVSVLNGSNQEGKAGKLGARLRRMGFHVIEIGNYDSETEVPQNIFKDFRGKSFPLTEKFLKKIIPFGNTERVDPALVNPNDLIDLQIILGRN